MAVGEMSPENENSTSALRGRVAASGAASPRIRKQDSYLKAIGNNEDELSPLPRYVFKVAKYNKKSFQHLTTFFMST